MTPHSCPKFPTATSNSGIEAFAVAAAHSAELVSEQNFVAIRQRAVELYGALRPSLHGYLGALGMSRDQAEDVIQETFLRFLRYSWPESAEENQRGWVFRVAHNLSMDVHRFERRWCMKTGDETRTVRRQRVDPGPSPEEQFLLEERCRRIQNALAELIPKHRQCVLLRAAGLRYREIARILGVSVQRVGELIQRSISMLEVHG